MRRWKIFIALCCFNFLTTSMYSQIDEERLGAWYMYFWNTSLKDSPIGFQGDVQYRNWNLGGDLEQLLLRGGVTYQPTNTKVKLTLGYGHIITGVYGDGNGTSSESRIYQEALLPQKIGNRIYLNHRFRFEQRFVENQDFRTRYRYNLFLNIPLNQTDLGTGSVYLAMYNELFVNGQKNIGEGRVVELFDRNRAYIALGHTVKEGLKIQLGYMRQVTDNWGKNQMQVSLHHKF